MSIFVRFCLVFADALGKAIVREVAWLTIKAARNEMEARDRYVRRTSRPPVVMKKDGDNRVPGKTISYDGPAGPRKFDRIN